MNTDLQKVNICSNEKKESFLVPHADIIHCKCNTELTVSMSNYILSFYLLQTIRRRPKSKSYKLEQNQKKKSDTNISNSDSSILPDSHWGKFWWRVVIFWRKSIQNIFSESDWKC